MHRSCTSALTGLLGGLGLELPRPSDLMRGRSDNPNHFESQKLVDLNDRLLLALGGWWDAPPDLAPGWDAVAPATAFDDEARAALGYAYPGKGPKVWKDPRLCLLLPFWSRHLDGPGPAILIWRDPGAVADSLSRRDGSTTSLGLALWERHHRSALQSLTGHAVFVLEADALVGDPAAAADRLATWLDGRGIRPGTAGGWDVAAGGAAVSPRLVHDHDDRPSRLPGEIREAVELLRSLDGPHDALPPVDLPPAPDWATDALREHVRFRGRIAGLEEERRQTLLHHEELETAMGELHQRLEELEGRHSELVDEHKRLDELSESRGRYIADLEAAAEVTGDEMTSMRDDMSRLTHEAEVARRYAERQLVEINRIHQSRSWRLTAPLRHLGGGRGAVEPDQ